MNAPPSTVPSRKDWLQTVRQSIPILRRVLANLQPTHEFASLASIDAQFLEANGIRGILWDIDGTLTHYHATELAPDRAADARRLFRIDGLRHAIVSNSDDIRFRQLGQIFPDVPVLKLYEAQEGVVGRRLEGEKDTWVPRDPGAQPLRAVRKPSAELIQFAVSQLGLEPSQVVMIGDQYWTDVAGANLAGVRTVRVPTAGRQTFPMPLRLMQKVEGWMRRIVA